MIRYALACDSGHSFESWFSSASAYEEQAARGLVECPFCGSKHVDKQIMAPAVARTDRGAAPRAADAPDAEPPSTPRALPVPAAPAAAPEPPVALLGEEHARLRTALRRLHAEITEKAEDVGRRFADEARKIHAGDAPERLIMGQADREEVSELLEEGVPIAPLPVLPDERN